MMKTALGRILFHGVLVLLWTAGMNLGLRASETVKTDEYKAPTAEFIDGQTYDGRHPNAYLKQFAIGLKD